RENIYRMIFEMRKAAENLDALSDDLRRNPWKLTNKTREVRPSPRARQEKMEELMLSTGRMGLAPSRR
ncbi:MAG: MCE family protein, partial [Mariprofundaceae bacterium]|nr:MCE family protein [Mariprofundaceae bacterium]